MPNPLKSTVISVLYPIDKFTKQEWTKDKIEKWITQASGRHLAKFTDDTTHLVCSEKAWRSQVAQVKQALEATSHGQVVKIVSPDWLEEALRGQRKPKEGPYLWERLDKGAIDTVARKAKNAAKVEREAGPGAISAKGMMAEVFEESTEGFVDRVQMKKLERQAEKARKEATEKVQQERREREEEKRKKREEVKAIFSKGAKKARNDIFSDNHHFYTDSTGFKYDVLLTKVDTRKNRNERYALTLYESNSAPCTYAFNLHFAGTGKLPTNDVVAALGCPFPTALRAFKKAFKEKTRVDWDERISFAVERARARGEATGSPEGTQRGRAVSEERTVGSNGGLFVNQPEEFEKQPFQYHPPVYGPRGVLPEKEKLTYPETGPSMDEAEKGKKRNEIQLWTSGTSDAEPEQDIVRGATPQNNAQEAESRTNGTSDFEQFISGALVAAGGASTLTDGMEADIFGLGDTRYPFDDHDHGATDKQSFGCTQVAEAAQLQLQEFFNGRQGPITIDSTNHDPGLDLGSSLLAKRKATLTSEGPAEKKRCLSDDSEVIDAPEGANGPSYDLAAVSAHADGDTPRDFAGNQDSAAQLEAELMSQIPEGELIQVD